LPIRHEDGACWVLDKPAGLPSVPGRKPELADCAASRAQALWPQARVVHRLDMATSGLLLLARGAHWQREFSRLFEQRQIDKGYEAVVHGCVMDDEGEIDAPLAADWPRRPRQQVDPVAGKASRTRYRVIERGPELTRLSLQPLTGRTHQLRVHLAHIGHPILGDSLYGAGLVEPHTRLMLHACRLAFLHPLDGQRLVCESPAPF
jgi:tRNA pseudouridine32 synthase / 23S rRNA pseudouridine746 synthase